MIRIAFCLVPDIIGSGIGSCRDGCGIKGFIRRDLVLGGRGILYRAVVGGTGIDQCLRGAGVGQGLGCWRSHGRGSLVDRHIHVLGRLCVGRGFRRCDSNNRAASLQDGQCAGVFIHSHGVATLDRIADCTATRGGFGHTGADALVRVAVGGGHIRGGNGLCLLFVNRNSNSFLGKCLIIRIFRNGDLYRYTARSAA